MRSFFSVNRFFLLAVIFVFNSCKTSGDLRSESNGDPGEIRTVENPVHKDIENRDPVELSKELAMTKGKLEEVKYTTGLEIQKLQEKNEKLQTTNTQLIQELEKLQWTGFSQGAGEDGEASSASLLWEKALQNLEKKEYERAQTLFETFSKTHPKNKGVFYAQLAQAMIFYQLKKYRRSLIAFNKVIDAHPKHKRVSLAWFGQGAAFSMSGQNKDARLFFEEARRRSPKSKEALWSQKILKKKAKVPENLFEAVSDWKTGFPLSAS